MLPDRLVVAAATLAAFATGPGQSWVVSVFVDSLVADTGLGRVTVSTLYAVATALSAACAVAAGRLADRYGPRAMLLVTAGGLGVACALMAGATGAASLLLAFAALRVLGQGAMPVEVALLVAAWFVRTRGRAMAVVSLGYAASSALLPVLARALTDTLGWRPAWLVLGVLVWALVLPAVALGVRDAPEADGEPPDAPGPPAAPGAPPTPPARRAGAVLGTHAFWMLAVPLAVPALVLTALFFHQAALFAARGLGATVAAAAFVPYAIASVPATLLAGVVVDRIGPRAVLAGNLGVLVVAVAGVGLITGPWSATAYAAVLGVSGGVQPVVAGVLWAHYYGRHGLGAIQGPAAMVVAAGAALGPLPLAIAHRLTGDYVAGLVGLGAFTAAAAALAMRARPPHRGEGTTEAVAAS